MSFLTGVLPFPDESSYLSIFSDDFVDGRGPLVDDFKDTFYGMTPLLSGSFASLTLPSIAQREAIGSLSGSFGDQFIDAVHMDPQLIALGNLLSTQYVDVEIWNNHRQAMTLAQILEESTDGITLTEPAAAPTVFQPNEYRIYQVSVSTLGPPTIDGSYTFDFSVYTMALEITGMRVVVWPFVPQANLTETIEFKTNVIKTKNGEQRIAKRINPRVSYQADYFLIENDFSRIKAMMSQWGFRQFGFPVWPEMQKIGAVPSGTETISIDTTESTYEVGGMIILHDKNDDYETIGISEITDTEITLALPTSKAFTNAVIMPLMFCYLSDGVDVDRSLSMYPRANATFLATDTVEIAADTEKTQLREKDVFLDRSVILSNLSEKLFTDCETLDNGQGVIVMDPLRDFAEHEQTLSRSFTKRSDLWLFKQWLYSLRGKQKSFFIPTWNQDISVISDLTASSTSILCESIGYALYYGQKDLMIETTAGAIHFYVISSALDNGDGTETLYLTSQIGFELPASDIKMACFLSHIRFDADRIELSYGAGGHVTVSIPTREVPE